MKQLIDFQTAGFWSKPSGYLPIYQETLAPWYGKKFHMLEIGIASGSSLKMWRDYFEFAEVHGVEYGNLPDIEDTTRLHMHQGEQQDAAFIDSFAPAEGFDIVIDDGAHIGQMTRDAFWPIYENHLNPGGVYVIEDWGCSFWPQYPDGALYSVPSNTAPLLNRIFDNLRKQTDGFWRKVFNRLFLMTLQKKFTSHPNGMVGFAKQLVDEVARRDYTHPERGKGPLKDSRIASIEFRAGMIVIKKPK